MQINGTVSMSWFFGALKIVLNKCIIKSSHFKLKIFFLSQVIAGSEYGWVMKMGQWPMSHSVACKSQDFDGPFEVLMGHYPQG